MWLGGETRQGDGVILPITNTTGSAYTPGQPIVWGVAKLPCVVMNDIAATTGVGFGKTSGVFLLSVYAYGESANEAVVAGDKIYLDTGVLNKDETNGDFFGIALEAVTSGSTTLIKVFVGGTPSVDVA
jgi:hypothetical protein